MTGDLKARNIGMSGINALFVLGDVDCEKFEFYGTRPAFIQGHLRATQAILARGQDDDDCQLGQRGRNNACVQGSAHAPQVRTWYMPLAHLNWAEGSGREFAEDEELDHTAHLDSPIWRL